MRKVTRSLVTCQVIRKLANYQISIIFGKIKVSMTFEPWNLPDSGMLRISSKTVPTISQLQCDWAQIQVIVLQNDGHGFGFGISGSRNSGAVVRNIFPGGAADRVRGLNIICQKLAVNVRRVQKSGPTEASISKKFFLEFNRGRPLMQNPRTNFDKLLGPWGCVKSNSCIRPKVNVSGSPESFVLSKNPDLPT